MTGTDLKRRRTKRGYDMMQRKQTSPINVESQTDNRALVMDALLLLNELNGNDTIERLQTYFSPNYRQESDTHTLTYKEFMEHLYALRDVTAELQLRIVGAAAYGETVLTHHIVTVRKVNSKHSSTVEVYAHFTVQDGHIVACREMAKTLHGDEAAAALSHVR